MMLCFRVCSCCEEKVNEGIVDDQGDFYCKECSEELNVKVVTFENIEEDRKELNFEL